MPIPIQNRIKPASCLVVLLHIKKSPALSYDNAGDFMTLLNLREGSILH